MKETIKIQFMLLALMFFTCEPAALAQDSLPEQQVNLDDTKVTTEERKLDEARTRESNKICRTTNLAQ